MDWSSAATAPMIVITTRSWSFSYIDFSASSLSIVFVLEESEGGRRPEAEKQLLLADGRLPPSDYSVHIRSRHNNNATGLFDEYASVCAFRIRCATCDGESR